MSSLDKQISFPSKLLLKSELNSIKYFHQTSGESIWRSPFTPDLVVYSYTIVRVMHTSIVTHLNTLYTNKSSMQFINPSPTRGPLYGPTNCVPTCKSPVQILILASVLFELLIYRPLSNIRKATNEPFSERFLLT